MKLQKDIESYQAKNEQERTDKEAMLTFISRNPDYLLRRNLVGHFTSSAIIVNNEFSKVLFVHHNIYNSWGWVGGHNDGEEDSLYVALKEAKEETGLENIELVTKDIIGLDTIYVMSHIKNKTFVSDHLHFNLTYLLRASEEDQVTIKADENSGVAWFDIEDIDSIVSEDKMKGIYHKLIKAAKLYQ